MQMYIASLQPLIIWATLKAASAIVSYQLE